MAIDERGKRHSHQRRIKRDALQQARTALRSAADQLPNCATFEELLALVEDKVGGIRGLGELYLYDTALRIGSWLGVLPRKVYLHAGAREGAKALGWYKGQAALDVTSLPEALHQLRADEIEDFLCIYKARLKQIKVPPLPQ